MVVVLVLVDVEDEGAGSICVCMKVVRDEWWKVIMQVQIWCKLDMHDMRMNYLFGCGS